MIEPSRLSQEAQEQDASDNFEGFFEREYTSVTRALLVLTGDSGEAEDLAEESFARTYEHWDRVREMESPVGYVYRAAVNLYRTRLRRERLRIRHRNEPRPAPEPHQDVEDRIRVLEALASLPLAQREAVVLVAWLGYGAEEAGRILGVDAAAVRSRLYRARAALRERFGGIEDE